MSQRVQYKDGTMSGIVRDRDPKVGKTLVHWGTADRREVVEWVDDEKLEACPLPVFSGDPETGKKEMVYDPGTDVWEPWS